MKADFKRAQAMAKFRVAIDADSAHQRAEANFKKACRELATIPSDAGKAAKARAMREFHSAQITLSTCSEKYSLLYFGNLSDS